MGCSLPLSLSHTLACSLARSHMRPMQSTRTLPLSAPSGYSFKSYAWLSICLCVCVCACAHYWLCCALCCRTGWRGHSSGWRAGRPRCCWPRACHVPAETLGAPQSNRLGRILAHERAGGKPAEQEQACVQCTAEPHTRTAEHDGELVQFWRSVRFLGLVHVRHDNCSLVSLSSGGGGIHGRPCLYTDFRPPTTNSATSSHSCATPAFTNPRVHGGVQHAAQPHAFPWHVVIQWTSCDRPNVHLGTHTCLHELGTNTWTASGSHGWWDQQACSQRLPSGRTPFSMHRWQRC